MQRQSANRQVIAMVENKFKGKNKVNKKKKIKKKINPQTRTDSSVTVNLRLDL